MPKQAASRLRKHARAIFDACLKAADPVTAVARCFRRDDTTLHVGRQRYKLDSFRQIYVLGAGKASAVMAIPVERALGKRITAGSINTKYGHGAKLRIVGINECGHPVPDQAGVEGARTIAHIAGQAGPDDLVVFLISGGASALTPYPVKPITLEEKQQTTRLLLESGAAIQEINAVRKHISSFKGGQLARLASPATLISLVLSDVIGDPLDAIGSGPTVPDNSTFEQAHEILTRYGIAGRVPASVARHIQAGIAGEVQETPKPGDAIFSRTQNLIVGSNRVAVDAAAEKARELGYRPIILSTLIEGETKEIARMHAAIAREARLSGRPLKPPAAIITGGETTVTLKESGLGGRNQEFVLAAAIDLAGVDNVAVLSGGTDGTDGPTDAAGAICDGATVERARSLGLDARDFLARHDSYHFLEPLGDLVVTGPTRTNVMDVRIVLVA